MIHEIHIQGYKTLQGCGVELGKLNVLIGENMSGKTNFLKALKFLQQVAAGKDIEYGLLSEFRQSSTGYLSFVLKAENETYALSHIEVSLTDDVTKNSITPTYTGEIRDKSNPHSRPEASPKFIESMLKDGLFFDNIHTDSNAPIRQPQNVAPFNYLSSDGSNLTNILLRYMRDDGFRQDLKKIMKYVNPDFLDVYIEPVVGNYVNLTWKEKYLSRDLYASDLSDGTLRLLCLCAILLPNSVAPPPKLICIDEPETGLYPRKVFPLLVDLIKAKAEESQIIISTHSPELLNHFQIDEVIVAVREEVKTRFERPKNNESLRALLQNYEFSMSDLWMSGKFDDVASNLSSPSTK
jgi:predicted ATPase